MKKKQKHVQKYTLTNMSHAVKSPWNLAISPVSQHPGGFCHLREQHVLLLSPHRLPPHLHMAWHHHQTSNPSSKLFAMIVVRRTYPSKSSKKHQTSAPIRKKAINSRIYMLVLIDFGHIFALNLLRFIFSTLPWGQKIRLARPFQLPPWDFDLTKSTSLASCDHVIMSYKICDYNLNLVWMTHDTHLISSSSGYCMLIWYLAVWGNIVVPWWDTSLPQRKLW